MTDETSSAGAASNETPGEKGLSTDIAKILQDAKLPLRRENTPDVTHKSASEVKDIDALLSQSAPTPPAPQPVSQPPAQVPEEKDVVRSLHTLKHDLQDVVRDQKISVIKAAALEQDKERPAVFATPPHSNRIKNFIFASFVLLFLGGAALGGVYYVVQDRKTALPQVQDSSLVFAEQTVSLPLGSQSPAQLKGLLSEARAATNASLGSITRIAPVVVTATTEGEVQRLATLGEFFSAIDSHPPEELMRAVSSQFFFGLHTVDTNAPLIVVPVTSYDRAFAAMLEWEATLNADLAPIYSRVPDLTIGDAGIPVKRTFEDVVMRNYDVRALKDDSGEVAMYYSFPTRNVLVIAESPYTFTELLSRLQAQKKL